MLRMVLLGLLIPLGVGVLSAMELRTPPRSAVAIVPPPAETTAAIADSHRALAKADRLEIAAVSSEAPVQPPPVDERIAPPEGISEGVSIGSPPPPRPVNRHRHDSKPKHDPKPRKATVAALAKPKPKPAEIKRTTVSQRSKAAHDTEPCRLKAFGGLLRALNSADCEI